jgi:hypothetical protein
MRLAGRAGMTPDYWMQILALLTFIALLIGEF